MTEGIHCSRCGEIIKKQKIIPRLGLKIDKQENHEQRDVKAISHSILNTYQEPNKIIYIVSGWMKCTTLGHKIIQMYAIVRDEKRHDTVRIPIQRCINCDFYFIRKEVFEKQEKIYGKLWFNFRYGVPEHSALDVYGWNEESDLHKYGYNVSTASNLSASTRQDILAKAIIFEHMSQQYIMEQISMLIHLNKNRYQMRNAVEKWQEDLEWLSMYDIENLYILGKLELYRNKKDESRIGL